VHFSRFKDILFYIIFFSLNIFQYQISIPIEMKNFESFLGLIKNLLKRRKIGANIDNAIDWKPTLKCFALRLKYFLCKEKVEAFHLIVRHKIWQLSNCEIQLSKCWLTYRSHLKSIWNHLSYSFIYYSFLLSIPSRKYQLLVIYLNRHLSFWVTLILLVKIMH
jgi:hypothetical protein